MTIRTVSRALAASAAMLALASEISNAQEAADPTSQNGAAGTALPPLDVTATAGKKTKAKVKAKAKATPAKAAPIAAKPEPLAPKAGDGGSTPAGSVNGYVTNESSVGTKTATPLQEVPQSISTVTRQQFEDRKPQSLGDSLAYVPGVRTNQSGFDPRFDTFYIRGFDATYTGIYRDGLRQLSSGFGQFRTEPYGLDSITILRGPSAALYGSSNAGGIVDMYSKRPTETPFREVEYLMGNHDRFQGNFDFSGPAAGGNVLYRMTGVVRDSDTEAMGVPDDRLYLAPAFTFKLDADTKLTVFGEYMDAKTGGNMAWLNDVSDPNHPRRTNIWSGDPAFNAFDQTQERVGYEFEHRVNDGVTIRQKARYSHLDEYAEYIDIRTDVPQPLAPHEYSRSLGIIESDVHTANMDNQVEARVATGPVSHTVLAGIDLTYITYKEGSGSTVTDVPPLIDFNYGQQHIPRPPISAITKQDQLAVGTYLQDQLKLDRWVLTLSGRHDWAWTDTKTNDPESIPEDTNDQAWSGRAGLTYLFDFGLAPYIAYGTSFIPSVGYTDGSAFKPTTAKSKEIGFKYLVPGYNASLDAALFDIEQENGIFYDPKADRNVQRGTLRSRGFEIEGITSLDNGLSLQASYSYIDMEIVEGEEGTNGKTLSSTPRHTFSIWGDYTIGYGALRGLGFGSGVRYIGTSFGNDQNTFENKAHALVDASVHYDLAGLDPQFAGARLQLNVNNVFDKQVDVCSSNYCYLDQGRTVLGSLRYRW